MAKALMRKDLTGMRFGKLVVLYVDEERTGNGKVYWWCQCDCGKLTSVQSTSLTRKKGGVKSCGCARNSKESKEKLKITKGKYPNNLSGLTFGKLTVIRKTDNKANNGQVLWECLCECDSTCYYTRTQLVTDCGVRSCGCLYTETRHTCRKTYCEYDLTTYNFGIGYCNNGTHFYFDKEDYDKIKNYSWWYDGNYVCAHSLYNDKYTTKIVRLHRIVMDIEDREDINVDHKNLVRYDCRKINLRRATDSENGMNKNVLHLSSTGIVGVHKENNKYSAYIKKDKVNIRLGLFDTIEEAAEVRLEAELQYFGEFRYNPEEYDIITEENLHLYQVKTIA